MARKRKHEEHSSHEAWAIPYGDLITLLLAFFVVMYAISSVNEGKYRVLSDSLVAAFRGTPRAMEPIQVGEKTQGVGAEGETFQDEALEGQPRALVPPMTLGNTGLVKDEGHGRPEQITRKAAEAARALAKVADQLESAMGDLIKDDMVVVRRNDFWIEVEIRTDILFPSASAQLSPTANDVIQRLAKTLAPFKNLIRVEGYTDNRPIKTLAFYSNWELSAARAASVVRVLANGGVDPARLAVIGYGETRPRAGNDTAEGRDKNRRVVMVILSTDAKPSDAPTTPAAQAATPGSPPGTDSTAPASGTEPAP